MALGIFGINHKTATVEVREKVSFNPEVVVDALHRLKDQVGVSEAAILSTCNRTEIYFSANEDISAPLIKWMAHFHQVDPNDLEMAAYIHKDEEACRHIMRVACGLDSLVLGEPQILGQLKSSYSVAREAGSAQSTLMRLFESSFSIAKQVRTETAIGENPVSVAFAAVSLSKHIFSDLSKCNVLLIGAGETIDLVTKHIKEQGVSKIVVANRTLTRAEELAKRFSAKAIMLSDIPDYLPDADIVISSTASQLPILGKGMVERAMKKRRFKPVFMADIAVPRDIEPQVADLEDVYLYTVDDLHEVVEENRKSRQKAAEHAEQLVGYGVEKFQQQLRSLDAVSTLTAFRQQAAEISDAELEKSLAQLKKGVSPERVLTQMARSLTNKLIHEPTVNIRQASSEGRLELIDSARELFGLNDASQNESQDS
ncbi:glutamyl-tRNA reductase [Litoribrevibacter albus]|uniref:Glutamyl-tRNA reductase n=1 Tax=Litoribrevibacter albus TaxID=1473156 RepID=A0AA37SDD3_9GAMM|nr:glutamyl-tRNA reductase [Litoribrevibacter albus]GLQ32466.1 glutamyl-tRNA reductase [Litoribrevibacter albus]